MKRTSSNKMSKFLLIVVMFIILTPVAILFVWTFASRWPWPNLLPKAYSLRAVTDIFAPHTKLFSTLLSSMLLSLTVTIIMF